MDKLFIAQELKAWFDKQGWTWSLKGRGKVSPELSDFKDALDSVEQALYAEGDDGGNMLQVGRLIIIREYNTFDVYVLAGTFQGEE